MQNAIKMHHSCILHDILFEYTQQHRSKLLNAHTYIKMHTVNISAISAIQIYQINIICIIPPAL